MNDEVQIAMSYRQTTEAMDNCQTSQEVLQILREEVHGPNRPAFVTRIYGRYDMMRRSEERRDIALATAQRPEEFAPWLQLPAAPAAKPAPQQAARQPRRAAPAPAPATPVQGRGAAATSKRAGRSTAAAR